VGSDHPSPASLPLSVRLVTLVTVKSITIITIVHDSCEILWVPYYFSPYSLLGLHLWHNLEFHFVGIKFQQILAGHIACDISNFYSAKKLKLRRVLKTLCGTLERRSRFRL